MVRGHAIDRVLLVFALLGPASLLSRLRQPPPPDDFQRWTIRWGMPTASISKGSFHRPSTRARKEHILQAIDCHAGDYQISGLPGIDRRLNATLRLGGFQ